MARYTYNAGLVTQTIDTLYTACDSLDNTNVDIKKGIDTILNARGAENLKIDFTPLLEYQTKVVEYIEIMANELQSKAQEIEEYQAAPWYKKLFATIGMGALKVVEGLATFVENIGDGLVSIGGFVAGIFSSDLKDSIAEFVQTDFVGDTVSEWYENGWLESVDKYSAMSHESTAANVLKGVGVAAGYVALSVVTAGAGNAVSLGVSAAAAGVGGIGSGTQSGLKAGMTFDQAFGQGVKQGVVAAGTTLVVGGLANKLGSLAQGSKVLTGADDIMKSADDVINNLDDAARAVITEGGDDTINILSKLTDKKGGEAFLVSNSAGGKSIVNAAGQFAKLGDKADEMINIMKNGGVVFDDIANGGTKTLTLANNAAKVADDVTNAAKTTLGQKVAGLANKGVEMIGKTKIGGAIGKGAAAIGTTGVNAIAAGAGSVTGGMSTAPVNDAVIDQMNETMTNPSIGQQLYADTQSALEQNIPSSATPEEAAQNLHDLHQQGYTPGGTITQTPSQAPTTPSATPQPIANGNSGSGSSSGGYGGNTGGGSSSGGYGGNTGGGSSSGGYGGGTITADPIDTPTPKPGNNASPKITPYPTTNNNNIVSNINPGRPNDNGTIGINPGRDVSSVVGTKNNVDRVTTTEKAEVRNTFGDVSGAIAGVTSPTTNIPTSSRPILSSSGKGSSTNTFVPLGAGLGAASLAGIGAKAYIDKREKDKEETDDEIQTEEWSGNDNVEIDYGTEKTEDADYLNPSDELAFTE